MGSDLDMINRQLYSVQEFIVGKLLGALESVSLEALMYVSGTGLAILILWNVVAFVRKMFQAPVVSVHCVACKSEMDAESLQSGTCQRCGWQTKYSRETFDLFNNMQ